MTKTLSTDLTPANIVKVMEILDESPARLEILSRSVPVKKQNQPLGEGERSLTQMITHLINSEARTSEAIYLALLWNEPMVADVHPERDWGRLLRYDLFDFAELLAYFKFRRAVLLRVLSGLAEAQWSRSIQEAGKKRRESVYWRARSLALHETEHLKDLEEKVSRLK